MNLVECFLPNRNPTMLIVAVVISVFSSSVAVSLMSRQKLKPHWVLPLLAAVVFSIGSWSMHYVTMLSLNTAFTRIYETPQTLLSIVIVTTGCIVGFLMITAQGPRFLRATAAGTLVGGGVAAMHFIGLASMRIPSADGFQMWTASYDMGLVLAAIGVCFLFSIGGTLFATGSSSIRSTAGAAVCFVLSVCALHYFSMRALSVTVNPSLMGQHSGFTANEGLGVIIASMFTAVLGMCLASSFFSHKSNEAVRKASERFRQFYDAASQGILIHRNGIILDVNRAVATMCGQTSEDMIGKHVVHFVAPGSVELVLNRIRQEDCLADPVKHMAEIELCSPDDRRLPVEMTSQAYTFDDKPAVLVFVNDLSARRQSDERIRHMAHHDHLTGLPNRVLFSQRLEDALQQASRNNHGIAIMGIDLDRFKAVNDTMGHHVGDALLVQVADRLRSQVRDQDTVARLGGDEFALIQPLNDEPANVADVAGRIVSILSQPFTIDGKTVEIGSSVGIAIYPHDGLEPQKLVRAADTALYRAKEDGKGRFCFFETEMDNVQQMRLVLQHDLRNAIQGNQLYVHYQPLHNAKTMELEGFEALARWHHPVRGQISPDVFIPLAEECGLIGKIGHWVLETACKEAASWSAPYSVAVNLSPAQFTTSDLQDAVSSVLERTKLAPERLELEITEGLLIQNTARALSVLKSLKALGIRISLDDFGMGYSSLSHLSKFPFDKLKIDKSFIGGMSTSTETETIVRAIITLGNSLNLKVTAEGVETSAQMKMLRRMDCHQLQGYLLSRPMDQADLHRYTGNLPANDTVTSMLRVY